MEAPLTTFPTDYPDPQEIAAARRLVADPDRAASLPVASRKAAWKLIASARQPIHGDNLPPAASLALTAPIKRAA